MQIIKEELFSDLLVNTENFELHMNLLKKKSSDMQCMLGAISILK